MNKKLDFNKGKAQIVRSDGNGEGLRELISSLDDPWKKLGAQSEEGDRIWKKRRSFIGDVFYRFFHKTSAVLGLLLILAMFIFAFAGPYMTSNDSLTQNLDFSSVPPKMKLTCIDGRYYFLTATMKVVRVSESGELLYKLEQTEENGMKKRITFTDGGEGEAREVNIQYKKKPVSFVIPKGQEVQEKTVWNKNHLLGTDSLGRDMLARLMAGARISLIVALIATLVNLTVGMIYGGISAFSGGIVDDVMMRIVDIISAVPLTLYVILLMVIMDSGFLSMIVALASVYWISMARVVRGQLISLKEEEFVLAARTIGTSGAGILFRHLLPNAMGPILVTATMQIPSAIFNEAFLSFIGLGIASPSASLGTMCNDAIANLRTDPYQLFLPALVICIIMFAFNFVGDGLRDAIDPKLRR